MTNKTFSALPLAATLLLFSASASAEEIKLRVADTFPAGHFISENLTKVWMARVAELTDGKVTFDYFTSGQLGKIPQMMDLVQNDIVDIAYVPPSSYADRVPLAGVGELPGFFTDAATGGAAFQKLLRTDLIKTEFDQYGVAPLFGGVLPQYQVAIAGDPIRSDADFADIRLRTPGGVLELAASELGALAVPMGGPEMYTAFQRGTVDATLNAYGSMASYKLNEVLRSVSNNGSFGTFSMIYVIDQDKLGELPEAVRGALVEAGDYASASFSAWVDGNEKTKADAFKAQGITIYEIPEDVVTNWNARLFTVAEMWANRLKERGQDGPAALDAWKGALAAVQ